jgi:hypothetical protein
MIHQSDVSYMSAGECPAFYQVLAVWVLHRIGIHSSGARNYDKLVLWSRTEFSSHDIADKLSLDSKFPCGADPVM